MTPRSPSARALRCAVPVIAAALAGCGAGDTALRASTTTVPTPTPPPSTVLKLRAPKSGSQPFHFNTRRLTAKAGRIRIQFTNEDDGAGHNVRIQTGGKCCFGPHAKDLGGTDTITHGTITAEINLKPGKYWFLCAPLNHWSAGMYGRLIVR